MARHEARGRATLRLNEAGQPRITDGGHLILDALFGRISNPEALSVDLNEVPGVVEHGLFVKLCARAYIAGPDGVISIDP
jgi:ribose 5-phosphate isomerase A